MKLDERQLVVFRIVANVIHPYGDTRLVGGAVRDILLGNEPHDLDFATDVVPNDVVDLFDGAGFRTIETGLKHGTITVIIDGEPVEITTLRRDTNTDGRHAEVQFTDSWEEDALRRDFTVNAMSMDPYGHIYDYFGGHEDLNSKLLKFVGDPVKRIEEDHLRMLRYYRFKAKLDWSDCDMRSDNAVRNSIDLLKTVSGERVKNELFKTYETGHLKTIVEMVAVGVYTALGRVNRQDTLFNTRTTYFTECQRYDPLCALSHFILDNTDLEWARTRLKLSNAEFDTLQYVYYMSKGPELHAHLNVAWMQERLVRKDDSEQLKTLLRFWNRPELVAYLPFLSVPAFPIRGNDLLERGVKPGRDVGNLINEMFEYWIDSNYKADRNELLARIG